MNDYSDLTAEQQARIEATLKRIRGGLKKVTIKSGEEPAHLFAPEVYHAR